jgi:hypothetical protein
MNDASLSGSKTDEQPNSDVKASGDDLSDQEAVNAFRRLQLLNELFCAWQGQLS